MTPDGCELWTAQSQTFSFMVQRIAAMKTQDALRVLAERLARTTNAAEQAALVSGISQIVKKP